MKKGNQSKLSVKRISTSPYFRDEFSQLEKKTIEEKNPGAEMLPLNSSELAQILITNTHTDVKTISNEQILACELMIHPNSGYDNLSADFIGSSHFPIVIGNPIRSMAVTNFILSALLSHYSPLPSEKVWNDSRSWKRKLLSELSILIVGNGHIGSLIQKSLSALAKNVTVYDPYQDMTRLVLKDTDVVIMACSLNEKNKHMINKKFLLDLNQDFLLINAARGQLVNTQDLMEVLLERPKAFAVLDVFEAEPADFSIFSGIKNIQVTSHIAGVYQQIDLVTANFEAEVIHDFKTMTTMEFEDKYKKSILKNRLTSDGFLI